MTTSPATPPTPRVYEAPLVIREENGVPSVRLMGMELNTLLASDGVTIEPCSDFDREFAVRNPFVVTLKFGPGALTLDFEVDLLESMLARKASA